MALSFRYGITQQLTNTTASSYASPSNSILAEHSDGTQFSLNYLGSYQEDGRFSDNVKRENTGKSVDPAASHRAEVPAFISLSPREVVVENFEKRFHASEPLRPHSLTASLLDQIVRFAYGRNPMFGCPTHVVTDSRHRLIVADTQLNAVHVIDPANQTPFRIVGGPHRQLRSPRAVAVDSDDNIYVVDDIKRVILIFSPEGRFIRSVGEIAKGESIFEQPVALFIDKPSNTLYVADFGADEILVLSREGKLLSRLGGRDRRQGAAQISRPTEVTASESHIFIVDNLGTRVQVLDKAGNPTISIDLKLLPTPEASRELGLAVDNFENIYVTNLPSSKVRIYRRDGELLRILGSEDLHGRQLDAPSGVWIDPSNRVFIADSNHSRILLFQEDASAGDALDNSEERTSSGGP